MEQSSNYLDIFDDQIDIKQKLRTQIEDMQEEVKSICSDREESPRSVFQKHSSLPKFFSPISKGQKKPDELTQLKKEVSSWSNCIKDMQKSIEKLSKQLNRIEETYSNREYLNELQEFKEEILQEIKSLEFGSSSMRETQESPEEVVRKMLRNWEEQVYRPQINTLAQKIQSRLEVPKEDPQEIMRKLKEKLALKAELERRKQMIHEDSLNEEKFKLRVKY